MDLKELKKLIAKGEDSHQQFKLSRPALIWAETSYLQTSIYCQSDLFFGQ